MPKFIVDLSLDGYESEDEETAACIVFIEESLDFSASSVSVEPYNEAAITTRLQEAEAIISYQYEVMGKYLTTEQISEDSFRRAAARLKGGEG